jgi:predicted secreted acid phosphatase
VALAARPEQTKPHARTQVLYCIGINKKEWMHWVTAREEKRVQVAAGLSQALESGVWSGGKLRFETDPAWSHSSRFLSA